jgi:molecular chaperone HscB
MPPAADKNYFELFGLPVAFELDVAQLGVRYRELAREAHPDRYASGSDSERRLAMQMTTLFNEAFRVLKQPTARASYLLELKGARLAVGTAAAVDPAFLMEQMELRERLDEARGDRVALDALSWNVLQLSREREQQLQQQLSCANWQPEAALRTVQEMQFLDKLRQQIADLEEESS